MPKNLKHILLLSLFIFFFSASVFAQKTRTQLEEQRRKQANQMAKTKRIYLKTIRNKEATISNLKAINARILGGEGLQDNYDEEIALINEEVYETEQVVEALGDDLEKYKEEYKEMLYVSSKTGNGLNKLSYLFSSSTFNQLMARMSYFEQYKETRKMQIQQIGKVLDLLNDKKIGLVQQKEEKGILTQDKNVQSEQLDELIRKKNTLIIALRKKEVTIKHRLEKERKAFAEYENLISEVIAKEAEIARKQPKKKDIPKKKTVVIPLKKKVKKIEKEVVKIDKKIATPKKTVVKQKEIPKKISVSKENPNLSTFEGNKGLLSLPVSEGFISGKFGKQEHPLMEGVWINNLGVDIRTLQNQAILAVFDGKVIGISKVTNLNYVIIVKHKDYLTIYAKIKTTNVAIGDLVKKNQKLGIVAENDDGISELQFQIWNNKNQNFNPEEWLKQ